MIIADLHIHSPFSRATSKSGLLPNLYAWAKVKGIDVVGTGDFTHPAWQAHLREHLQPAEPGLFKLKDENVPPALPGVIPHARTVRFMLTAEISSIYKQGGQVRKIHNLLFAPDFDSATRISAALAAIGNIEADGRPILGLSARNLLEIVLEKAPDAYLVPAHIWTPWFSLFGSKSGFDTLEDCFADLSPQVFALETGLSSDPEMNRLISALDRYTLISNSDSHSPSKLGREANLFDTPLDFYAMRAALAQPAQGFHGTLEFFPEEGKYHLDGHRHCGVVLEPGETQRLGGVCPRCGKPLTVGVLHRVMELADRDAPHFPAHAPVVHSLVPLPEVLGELLGCGPDTQKAQTAYADIIQRFGAEFEVLLHASLEEIRTTHSAALAEAMARIRSGRVIRQGGYDGEYGTIQVFAPGEKEEYLGQGGLFATLVSTRARRGARNTLDKTVTTPAPVEVAPPQSSGPNAAQWAAITHCGGHALVAAGPGTGKTYTLAARMAWLVEQGRADPARMAAITFTRRAAEELRERLCVAAGEAAEQIFTGTFHAFALHWLRQLQPDLAVVDETAREWLLQRAFAHWRPREIQLVSQAIAAEYQGGQDAEPEGALPMTMAQLSAAYQEILAQHHAVDIEGIIPALLAQVESNAELAARLRAAVAWLFVDEFQDVNAEQYRLVYLLAHGAEVFAIGDPDQAIYGFRGADWRYFGQFGTQFHATAFTLTHNYRNQATILAAAHAVMAEENPARASLLANRPAQARILWQQLDSAEQEAEWIGTEVEKWVGGTSHRALHSNEKNYGFQEIAVLYRLSAQAGMLHRALAQRGIPVQHVGVTPFFQAAPLRPVRWLTQAAQDPGARRGSHWPRVSLALALPHSGGWRRPRHCSFTTLWGT